MADNITIKDGGGSSVVLKTKDVGAGVECSQSIPTDTSGNAAWGTAGSANANVMTVQGIASGTPTPVTTSQGGNSVVVATAGADAASNTVNGETVYSHPSWYNGATWDRAPGNTSGLYAQGNVASGAADAGNPVKIGARYNSTLPTLSNGQRGDIQVGTRGSTNVTLFGQDTTSAATVTVSGDAQGGQLALNIIGQNQTYNGATWDRYRSVVNATNSIGTGIAAAGILAQLDDTAPTAITENQFGNLRMSADRSLLTTIQNSYAHISTSTTTTVKSGAGTLKAVIVNTLGTVASTTTIYDNTTGSGTVIGVINTLALAGTFTYDLQFATGLTLVTTGTVAPDITVSYK